jgi:FRG domain-containing protein
MPGSSTTTIGSVQEMIEVFEDFRKGRETRAHQRLWFRGQGDADWVLKPGVYRDTFAPAASERDRNKLERNMNQDFRVSSAGLRDPGMTSEALYFLQQHYGMPTRLLDWTVNPIAALYFAVSQPADEKDGAVFMMDVFKFDLKPMKFRDIATADDGLLQSAVRAVSGAGDFPAKTFPVWPDRSDIRMQFQRSGFTFHVPNEHEITSEVNRSLRKIRVAKDAKEKINSQLVAFGIDGLSIFGDLESLARHLKGVYGIGRKPAK